MSLLRNTKIIATLGPASRDHGSIRSLVHAGVSVFRLNFSHGTHDDHAATLNCIRSVESEVSRPIGVLLDLQGPKLRIGSFEGGRVSLQAGDSFRFDLDPAPGTATRVCLPHPEIFKALRDGDTLLVDDGRMAFTALRVTATAIDAVAKLGGSLSNRKGVNVPSRALAVSAMSDKDRADLRFGLDLGVDWVALSFVQRVDDVLEARELIQGRALLMAKIEKPAAMDSIEAIIAAADGIMVARGDLGVEMPMEEVPGMQKRMIRLARAAGKPVVIATQMLESMISAPCPTRAEASDVATAVYDGADAVMLSAETASGGYPVESVCAMDRIVRQTERDSSHQPSAQPPGQAGGEQNGANAFGCAVRRMSEVLPLSATVAFTSSGTTAMRMAHQRPRSPILTLTPSTTVARRLSLIWGVHARIDADLLAGDIVARATRLVEKEGLASPDKAFLLLSGTPFGSPGTTNQLQLIWP